MIFSEFLKYKIFGLFMKLLIGVFLWECFLSSLIAEILMW